MNTLVCEFSRAAYLLLYVCLVIR